MSETNHTRSHEAIKQRDGVVHVREELCDYLRKCSRAGTAHNQAADLLEADAAEIARLRLALAGECGRSGGRSARIAVLEALVREALSEIGHYDWKLSGSWVKAAQSLLLSTDKQP